MNSTNNYGSRPVELKIKKSLRSGKTPLTSVGNKNEKLSTEENDRLMGYLQNFIKSNKIKQSNYHEREKEQVIHKLKDFLVYLENKNLINSKIQDTNHLREIVDQLLDKESKLGNFYDNRRRSNPANDSYNLNKVYKNQQAKRDSSVEDTHSNSSKRKQSQRLIFQQSRSERNSLTRGKGEKAKTFKMKKKSAAIPNSSFKNSEKSSSISKYDA